jgi:methylamine dehydrogenase heavy chain
MIRTAACFFLLTVGANADVQPETVGETLLTDPQDTWFIAKGALGPGYIFDSQDGTMKGLLSLSAWTPSVVRHPERAELYGAEVHYSRTYRGKRTDIVSVIDHATLTPVAEIPIPNKVASLTFPRYLSLLSDRRLLTVFNMTPAQSVSIVDTQSRQFVTELSTPGCALTMPVENRGFLMLCGDGTLQLLRLDSDGQEVSRVRSDVFFSVEDDPVFDQPVSFGDSWQFISFEGLVYEASVEGEVIRVTEPWSVMSDEDAGWRVGGRQIIAVNEALNLMAVIVHQGGIDTHEDPGTQFWIFDRSSKRRIARVQVDAPINSILITAGDSPILVASRALEPVVDIYDIITTKKQRSINAGQVVGLLLPY